MSLHLSTAAELGRGLASREYSSVEVTRHFLDRIGRANAALNAFVTVTAGRALDGRASRGCAHRARRGRAAHRRAARAQGHLLHHRAS